MGAWTAPRMGHQSKGRARRSDQPPRDARDAAGRDGERNSRPGSGNISLASIGGTLAQSSRGASDGGCVLFTVQGSVAAWTPRAAWPHRFRLAGFSRPEFSTAPVSTFAAGFRPKRESVSAKWAAACAAFPVIDGTGYVSLGGPGHRVAMREQAGASRREG